MKQSKFIDMEFPVIDYNKEDCHGHSGLAMTDCWAWIQNTKLKKQTQFSIGQSEFKYLYEKGL